MVLEANKPLLGLSDSRAMTKSKTKSETNTVDNVEIQKADDQKDIETTAPEQWKQTQIETRESRGTWKHPLDFLFSCISFSIGLGTVWRFPYLCYKNGGGVFLIIYFICTVFCGVPVFLQEVAIGQYLGVGGMTMIAQICPIMKGVGIAGMVMLTYLNAYYCVIVSWSLYYFIASFVAIPDVPWNTCNNTWNTKDCWMPSRDENGSMSTPPHNHTVASVQEFWNNRVIHVNGGIEYGLGTIQWELAGTLLGSWIILYMIVWRGLHKSSYNNWFTAFFPYSVMIILLLRALTLAGAIDGLKAYINIDWKYMKQGSTWMDAVTQIFFTYGAGTGVLPALSSYNKFNHNCFRDAFITCIVTTCTCLTAGVLVFAILGNMAHLQQKPIQEVVRQGPGLVFLTYPELVLSLPASFIWAILFFAMLLTLGIDSQFCNVESLITGIVDSWQEQLLPCRKQVVVAICVVCFLLGLPMVTNGGIYLVQIVDFYAVSGFPLLCVCLFETVSISWLYGANTFARNIESMIGRKPHTFWHLCWIAVAPIVMSVVVVYYLYQYSPVTYGKGYWEGYYKYPKWAEVMGLLISTSSMIWVPLYAIYYTIRGIVNDEDGTLRERIRRTLQTGITPTFEGAEFNTKDAIPLVEE